MKPNPDFYGGSDISVPMFLDICEGGCGRAFNVQQPDGSMAVPSLDAAETCIDCANSTTTRRTAVQVARRTERRARDLAGLMHHRGQRVCANDRCRQPFRPVGREETCSPECAAERRRKANREYSERRRQREIRKVPAPGGKA